MPLPRKAFFAENHETPAQGQNASQRKKAIHPSPPCTRRFWVCENAIKAKIPSEAVRVHQNTLQFWKLAGRNLPKLQSETHSKYVHTPQFWKFRGVNAVNNWKNYRVKG